MTTPHPWLDAVSDDTLRGLAGDTVFQRGQAYARKGTVDEPEIPALLAREAMALQATVHGSEPYTTRVAIDQNNRLLGECDCPHALDGNFCKHQVAVALSLRAILAGDEPGAQGASNTGTSAAAKRAQTQARNRDTLRAFFQNQPAATLAEKLWAWAEGDRHLMADLKAWATQAQAQDDPAALKSAITDLLRDRHDFLDWRESGIYAARAAQVLDWIKPWLEQDAQAALDLCEHALRRLYKVAEHADDSSGEIGDLAGSLMNLFTDAVEAVQPPAKWLDRWFDLMKSDPWGLWNEFRVLSVAGSAVRQRYAELAQEQWLAWCHKNENPAPAKKRFGAVRMETFDHERYRLRQRYLDSLALQDDPRALLEVMTTSAQGGHEWAEAVKHCEAQGWFREAMHWATHAHKLHPNDRGVEDALLRACERDGCDDEALAIHRKRLEQSGVVEHYRACMDAARRAGRDPAVYRAELMEWQQGREIQTVHLPPLRVGEHRRQETVRVVSVRVSWLLADRDWNAAWALAQPPHRCDPKLLRQLARALPADRDADAATLLRRVLDTTLPESKSPYQDVLKLVREACSRMPADAARAWVNSLRVTHKARRNFVAGLPAIVVL